MSLKHTLVYLLFTICMQTKPEAQIRLSLNIGLQPLWGPVGYERADNYYLPDIETYYNVSSRKYTYQIKGHWITTYSLPPDYLDYDLYSAHKVVINSSRPYLNHTVYRDKYAKFRNRNDQSAIRNSRDNRYFENKGHPRHEEWKGNGHDNRDKNHDDRSNEPGEKGDRKDNGHHGR